MRILYILCFLATATCFGQEKFNVAVGFGAPDLLNASARYQLNQVQIGFSIGTMPFRRYNSLSLSGDVFYHFGGSSNYSERRPWYGRIGAGYLKGETDESIDKYYFLTTRMGRDFNISKKMGIAIDIGIAIELDHEEVVKKPSNDFIEFSYFEVLYPSLGITLFYRL